MPYDKIEDLPKNIRSNFPKHAQEIFKEALNNAWDEYKSLKIVKVMHQEKRHHLKLHGQRSKKHIIKTILETG
jgi:cation transport regulator ChaB